MGGRRQPRVFAVDHWLGPLGRGWCFSATVSAERGRESEECEKGTAKEDKWTLGVLPASVCPPAFPLQTKVMLFLIEIPAEVGVRMFWISVTSHTSSKPLCSRRSAVIFLRRTRHKLRQEQDENPRNPSWRIRKRGEKKISKLMDWIKWCSIFHVNYVCGALNSNVSSVGAVSVTLWTIDRKERESVWDFCSCSRCWWHLRLYREWRHFNHNSDWNSLKVEILVSSLFPVPSAGNFAEPKEEKKKEYPYFAHVILKTSTACSEDSPGGPPHLFDDR